MLESDVRDTIRRTIKSITGGEPMLGFNGLPKEMQQSFREGLANATPEAKEVLRQIYRKTDYVISNGKRSYYSSGFAKDIIHIGASASPSTLAHELFHKLDKGHEISRTFTESLTKDHVALNVRSGGNIKEYLLREYPKAFSQVSKAGEPLLGESYRGIADILNGLSLGRVYYGYGHTEKYWSNPEALEAEAWAQFGRMQYNNNVDVLKMLREVFPNFYTDAIIALKGMV